MSDLKAVAAGAVAWAAFIPVVSVIGPVTAGKVKPLTFAAVFGLHLGIAYATTPVMAALLGWKTSEEKVRGIAIGLGVAQVLDGVAHILFPKIYNNDSNVALSGAGNIFLGAGLLGLFSAYA